MHIGRLDPAKYEPLVSPLSGVQRFSVWHSTAYRDFLHFGVVNSIIVTYGAYIKPCYFAQKLLSFLILRNGFPFKVNFFFKDDFKNYLICFCTLN